MPFIDKLKQIEAAKAKLIEQEKAVSAEREQALAALPAEYGYDSLNAFIKALKAASGKGGRKARGAKAPKAAKKGKRARITDEVKQQVIAAVHAGKSGADIAKEFGISAPSVQNIKKEAGLVKPRATEAPAAPEGGHVG